MKTSGWTLGWTLIAVGYIAAAINWKYFNGYTNGSATVYTLLLYGVTAFAIVAGFICNLRAKK